MNKFWTVLLVVFLAEIPCILRTVALQLKTDGLWQVISGTLLGNAVALGIGLSIAFLIAREIPTEYENWIQIASGLLIVGIGLLMIFQRN